MTMNTEEYEAQLSAEREYWLERAAKNLDVDGALDNLDFENPVTDDHLSKLVAAKITTVAKISKARRAFRANAERDQKIAAVTDSILGEDPSTPSGFVLGRLRKLSTRVSFNGDIHQGSHSIDSETIKRECRISARNAGMNAGDYGGINDAVEQWIYDGRQQALKETVQRLKVRQDFDFDDLAKTYFVETELCDYKLIAAILRKFVHQVQTKFADRPVQHHLMPVIFGKSGEGKSYLVNQMIQPISDFTGYTNFQALTDDRNICLFEKRVLVLDEMDKAARADIESIKNIITSDTIERRPMRSNTTMTKRNATTLIGTTNRLLSEVIADETSTRRFAQLTFKNDVPHNEIERFSFENMWCAVQADDAEPLADLREELHRHQSQSLVLGPVQEWLTENRDQISSGTYTTSSLFDLFRNFRENAITGRDMAPRSMSRFSEELRRAIEQDQSWKITKVRTASGFRWHVESRSTQLLKVVGS
ncbi:hypothetical protein EH31_06550 [Erythrobacter longus]|uniref:Virulence-associated protein E-like domain-containing protein n=1 Tax=Erythrobacter longus TaxID=1044 RepID=A0A074M2C0_ERYLO|nr:VapE domain-containing protein [Erythrobacter longus]KEO86740.1 hypothetical protein EH31_06550 [Erythrobacter longus]